MLSAFKHSFIAAVKDIEGKTNLPLLFRAKLDKTLANKKDEADKIKIAQAVETAVAKAKAENVSGASSTPASQSFIARMLG